MGCVTYSVANCTLSSISELKPPQSTVGKERIFSIPHKYVWPAGKASEDSMNQVQSSKSSNTVEYYTTRVEAIYLNVAYPLASLFLFLFSTPCQSPVERAAGASNIYELEEME